MFYGYPTSVGYMGIVDNHWMLFDTESEYFNYVKEYIKL